MQCALLSSSTIGHNNNCDTQRGFPEWKNANPPKERRCTHTIHSETRSRATSLGSSRPTRGTCKRTSGRERYLSNGSGQQPPIYCCAIYDTPVALKTTTRCVKGTARHTLHRRCVRVSPLPMTPSKARACAQVLKHRSLCHTLDF